jgi:outer membrane protein assembly factor BamB
LSPNALRRYAAVLVTSLAGVAALSFAPASAQTADGSWTQYQGSGSHSGTLADGPEPPFRVRWTLPAPDRTALSGAVIAGDVAIAMDQTSLVAIDLTSGEPAWTVDREGGPISIPAVTAGPNPLVLFVDGGQVTSPATGASGATGSATTTTPATPSANASTTSASTTTSVSPGASASPGADANGEAPEMSLVALSLADHKPAWRAPIAAVSRTGITVDGDTAYVGDVDGTITAVSTADGSVRWTADAAGRIDAPLAASDGMVVAVSRDVDARELSISAFDASDGTPAWPAQTIRLTSTAASAPALADGTAYVGLPDRLVHAISLDGGTERWTSIALSVFSPVTSPAAADGTIYVADLSGGLYALNAEDGSRRWTFQFNDLVLRGAPVRSAGYVLLGLQDGRLVAVDDATGHLAWESRATPGLVGAIALGSDVVVAVKGGNDAGLIAFEPDPAGTLIDVASPTDLAVGTTAGRVAAAAAIAVVVVLVPGMLARRRFGDAFAAGGEDEGEEGDDA